ncbi:MAG: DUF2786 domain-containing protein, partial [Gordonia amarae]
MTDKITTRIAKLLAQSDGAGTEAEAEVFLAKAQELATLHSIDMARARHATRDKERTLPVQRVIEIGVRGTRGLNTLIALIGGIARANDVKFNIKHGQTAVIAFGFAEDIDVCEALYASLSVQMAQAVAQWRQLGTWRGETVLRPGRWYGEYEAKPVTWLTARLDFQLAFAHRVEERLAEAKLQAEMEAKAHEIANMVSGESAGTDLVLREKTRSVDEFYARTSTARGSYRGGRYAVSRA